MKNALGLSLGICGAVWTFLALGVLEGYALVWGGFIAWGCYFTNGKGTDNLQKTIVATIYGAVLAGVAVVIMGAISAYTGSLAALTAGAKDTNVLKSTDIISLPYTSILLQILYWSSYLCIFFHFYSLFLFPAFSIR